MLEPASFHPPLATDTFRVPSYSTWRPLGAVAPTALVDARMQLHHAAQVANAAAISLLRPEADDSHTAFTWDTSLGALVAREIARPRAMRFALHVADLTLLQLVGDALVAGYPLAGRTQAEALAWVQERITAAGGDGASVSMQRHFAIDGAAPDAMRPWRAADGAARELAAWWANASQLLTEIGERETAAGPVRCWPHHFDIATLLSEPRAADGTRHTIGIGLSPGDEYHAEPYWYVGPYPHPRVDRLPPLRAGSWQTRGWFGAVLTGSEVVAAGDGVAQERLTRAFVEEALREVRALRAAHERPS